MAKEKRHLQEGDRMDRVWCRTKETNSERGVLFTREPEKSTCEACLVKFADHHTELAAGASDKLYRLIVKRSPKKRKGIDK